MTSILIQPIELRSIRRCSRGEAVRLWQSFLQVQGLLDETPDGIFGRNTEAATQAYQRSQGLEDDGIVGRSTYAKAIADGFGDPLETIGLQELDYNVADEIVERWQEFLVGQGLMFLVSGIFDDSTQWATQEYQRSCGLFDSGIVDRSTYARAIEDGFALYAPDEYPAKPDFPPLYNMAKRQAVFGKFEYSPDEEEDGAIIIHGNWRKQNIVRFVLPKLKEIRRGDFEDNILHHGNVQFHRKAADQVKGLWAAWEAQNLTRLIVTYNSDFVPRYIRGSRHQTLSNHAFGSAFDINREWNKLGHTPAPRGEFGSVIELVSTAHDYGFYWGGHFKRKDGMHFEIGKILTHAELDDLSTKYGLV